MARRRVPGVRRRPGPMHLLLSRPWVRAPLAALSQPGASAAVLVATGVLGVAAATAPLFLSSAATGELHRAVSTCPELYRPAITNQPEDVDDTASLPERATRYAKTEDAGVRGVLASRGVPVQKRVLVLSGGPSGGVLTVGRPGHTVEAVTAYSAPDALANVVVLRGEPGAPGLWLPDQLAGRLDAGPGDEVVSRGRRIPVAGVYRGLDSPGFEGNLPLAWCRWAALILPSIGDAGRPVRPLVLADDATLLALAGTDRPVATWFADVDPATARASDAAAVASRIRGSGIDLFSVPGMIGAYTEQGPLGAAAARAADVRSALTDATRPAALAAVLVALLLVAAAGGYWAERRADEVRLMAARGVGPPALAGKAVLEMLGPALAGALLGWAATLAAAPRLGPSPLLDAGATGGSLRTVGIALAVGLLGLGAVAGLRGRSTGERPVGLERSRWRLVPWELLLVGAAAWAYLELRGGAAVTGRGEAVHVSPWVVAFPLLALAGLAVLAVRLLAWPAARLHGPADRLAPIAYLAARRLAVGRTVSAAALVAVALPVGLLVACASLTASVRETVHAKTLTYIGADVALRTDAPPGVTPDDGGRGTPVTTLPEATAVDATELPVLAVDPATFARYAYWRPEFAAEPLPDLLGRLGPAGPRGLPAILVATSRPITQVYFRSTVVRVDVVGRAAAFPGMRSAATPMIVVDRSALPRIDPYTARSEEIWTRAADAGAVASAIGAGGPKVTGRVTEDTIVRNTDLYPLTWTFGYVEVLAGLAGVIGVCALLLYLAARQRSRTAAYALSRRMGLSRRAHLASLAVELAVAVGVGALLGVLLARLVMIPVTEVLELEPGRPPYGSVLVLSAPAVLAVVAGAVLLVLLGALATQAVADRTRAADVLRGAE